MSFSQENGFTKDTFQETSKKSLETFQENFPNLDFLSSSVEGQLKLIQDNNITSLDESVDFIFSQLLGLFKSSGLYLERYTSFFGITRNQETSTTLNRIEITNIGVSSVTIDQSISISLVGTDNTSAKLSGPDVIINSGQTIELVFTLIEKGPIPFKETQSPSEIEISKSLDIEVINLEIGLQGRNRETDSSLRARYIDSLVPLNNSAEGLLKRIRDIEDISFAFYRENTSSIKDNSGQSAHSIAFYVDGSISPSVETEIGEILKIKPAGIQTFGNIPIDVIFDTGSGTIQKQVFYSIIKTVLLTVDIQVEKDDDAGSSIIVDNSSLTDLLEQTTLGFINDLNVGKDVLEVELKGAMTNSIDATFGGGVKRISILFNFKVGGDFPPLVTPVDVIKISSEYKARVEIVDIGVNIT